jgi:hypothetical protein
VASPANACSSAKEIGALGAGESLSESGVSVGSSVSWFEFSTSLTSFTVTVAGSGSPAATNDLMTLLNSCSVLPIAGADGVTSFTGTSPGTYIIAVGSKDGAGPDGGYTLTLTG